MKKNPDAVGNLKQASGLTYADVIDRVLDKGIVIEYHVDRVWLSGIELPVTMDARVVVASLDTYLAYSEPLRQTGLLEGTDAWLQATTIP
jgi:gas vesicle protein GvpA/GvpJ/GvpM family